MEEQDSELSEKFDELLLMSKKPLDREEQKPPSCLRNKIKEPTTSWVADFWSFPPTKVYDDGNFLMITSFSFQTNDSPNFLISL